MCSSDLDSGAIAALAVDFLQFDGGAMNDWIKGAIRFNSDLPIALIPETELPGFDAPEHAPPRSDAPLSGIIPLIPDHPGSDMAGSDLTPPQDDVQRNELIAFNPGADDWAAESDAWIWFSSGSAATMVDLPISTAIFAQTADVPGPLPAAAAVAGWRWSRRLRDRCGRRAALPSR